MNAMKKRNILVITYWPYKSGLIQAHVLPYVNIFQKYTNGGKVYLLTQETEELSPEEKKEIQNSLKSQNIEWLPIRYTPFNGKNFLRWGFILFPKLIGFILKHKINMLHAWCTPGGTIAFILSKLTATPMLVDFYEPHADSMVELKVWKKEGMNYKILKYFEVLQSHHAEFLICSNKDMPEYVLENYNYKIPEKKYFYKPNCIDFSKFYPRPKNQKLLQKLNLQGKIVGLYVGKFGGIYFEEETFWLFKKALEYYGKERFHALVLTPDNAEQVRKYAEKAEFPQENLTLKFVFHKHIPEYMSLADFAISPIKPVPSKRYSSPIKDGEYWAMGLPVIIPENISEDSEIIRKHNIGYVLSEISGQEFRKSIEHIDKLLNSGNREQLQQRIFNVAKTYRNFELAEDIYKKIYNQ